MTDAPSQSQDKFIVRLPDGMRERLKAVAERNRRSMNQEAVAALAFHLDEEEHFASSDARFAMQVVEGPPQDYEFSPPEDSLIVTQPDLDRIVERTIMETLKRLGVKGD